MCLLPPGQVFTRPDLLRAGWSDSAISRAARRGGLIHVRRGLFARPPGGAVIQAIAAARSSKGAVVSHRSAALLHGLPLLRHDSFEPELTVAPSNGTRVLDAHVHRATLRRRDVVLRMDTEVTSVPRTLIDLGRQHGTEAMVVSSDAALHRHLIRMGDLEDVARACWNWPGIRRATHGLSLLDPRAESPLESVSRLSLGRAGLPTPRSQVEIFASSGQHVGRTDFYWDEFGVVGEADGLGKYSEPDVLRAEKLRQERLELAGLIVVRWTWRDVVGDISPLRRRLLAAFARGHERERSGFVRDWSLGTR